MSLRRQAEQYIRAQPESHEGVSRQRYYYELRENMCAAMGNDWASKIDIEYVDGEEVKTLKTAKQYLLWWENCRANKKCGPDEKCYHS